MNDPRDMLAAGLEKRTERLEYLADNAEEEPWYRAHITFGLFVISPLSIVVGVLTLPGIASVMMVIGGVAYLLGLLHIYPEVRRARREAIEE